MLNLGMWDLESNFDVNYFYNTECWNTKVGNCVMNDKEKALLFKVFIGSVIVVNAIFGIALFKHYVLGNKVDGIVFINSCFVAEVLGVFFLLIKAYLMPAKEGGVTVVTQPKYTPKVFDDDVAKRDRGIHYLNLGRAASIPPKTKQKNLREAERIFKSIPENSHIYPSGLYNLIAVHRELNEFKEAYHCISELREGFDSYFAEASEDEKKSRDADLVFSEGLLKEREGKIQEAKDLYEESWRKDPSDFTAPFNLALICYRLSLQDEFAVWYEVLKKYPSFKEQIEPELTKGTENIKPKNNENETHN